MALTKEDLRDFTRFADEKLSEGGADSLLELAGKWELQRREAEETVADIRQSHGDIEAGRVNTVAGTFASIRKQLGLPCCARSLSRRALSDNSLNQRTFQTLGASHLELQPKSVSQGDT